MLPQKSSKVTPECIKNQPNLAEALGQIFPSGALWSFTKGAIYVMINRFNINSKAEGSAFMRTINRVLPGVVRKLIVSWLFAAVVAYFALAPEDRVLLGTNSLSKTSLSGTLLSLAACFAVLSVSEGLLRGKKKSILLTIERALVPGLFLLLAIPALIASYALPFLIAVLVVFVLLVVYALFGWDGPKEGSSPSEEEKSAHEGGPLPRKMPGKRIPKEGAKVTETAQGSGDFLKKHAWLLPGIVVGLIALGIFIFTSLWMAARVQFFKCPTYDMGIAAQMYHSMLKHGTLVTTVERAKIMSHLEVHFILIYYLWLPFYAVWPHPVTLEILQNLTLLVSVIPLWLLLRKRFSSPWLVGIIAAAFLFYPPLMMGISYDVHENCFLPVLILWLLWALDSRKKIMACIFAALLLVVKEDAAVYAAVIAIGYLMATLLRKNGKKAALDALFYTLILAVSVGWFLFTTTWLKNYGDGVMSVHYRNFFFGEHKSFSAVIYAVILSPMKVLYECVKADESRLIYFLPTLAVLLGLPFVTRKYERLIFLIPYFLVNLVSNNIYQHDVYFQYSFGSCSLLFCLAVLNWQDLMAVPGRIGAKKRQMSRHTAGQKFSPGKVASNVILGTVFLLCIVAFSILSTKADNYLKAYTRDRAESAARWQLLSEIPGDAEVAAGTFVTTQLWDRDLLWDIKTCKPENTLGSDYVVFYKTDEPRYREKFAKELRITDEDMTFLDMLAAYGFLEQGSTPGGLTVYRKVR